MLGENRLRSRFPLFRRTGTAYDEDMFRWLLILLFVCQTGLPHLRTCREGDAPQLSKAACCRVVTQERVPSCCQTKVSPHATPHQDAPGSSNPDCGDQRPCCGCCVPSAVYCLLPDVVIRLESLSCDRVGEECQPLLGLTWAPMTPPPNLNGVG